LKLPNFQNAFIPKAKLLEYLLSPSHPEGGPKAVFFNQAGYTKEDADTLADQLLQIARRNEVFLHSENEFGRKYIVDGVLPRKNGEGIPLRTVWVIDKGMTNPRFITAYPL
jgi:hypothetical protein